MKVRDEYIFSLKIGIICRSCIYDKRFECEHTCRDPKDGELCLNKVKPGETLVEARRDSNVQIDL